MRNLEELTISRHSTYAKIRSSSQPWTHGEFTESLGYTRPSHKTTPIQRNSAVQEMAGFSPIIKRQLWVEFILRTHSNPLRPFQCRPKSQAKPIDEKLSTGSPVSTSVDFGPWMNHSASLRLSLLSRKLRSSQEALEADTGHQSTQA